MISTTKPIDISIIEDSWTAQVVQEAVAIAKAAAEAHVIREVNGTWIGRQGDCFLRKIEGTPTGDEVKPGADGHIYLIKGEATGHTHSLKSRDASYFLAPAGGNRFVLGHLVVPTESVLVHNEHGPIIVPPGTWEVRRQWQGAEFGERVAD